MSNVVRYEGTTILQLEKYFHFQTPIAVQLCAAAAQGALVAGSPNTTCTTVAKAGVPAPNYCNGGVITLANDALWCLCWIPLIQRVHGLSVTVVLISSLRVPL
jgi:hypothetical protein